MTTPTQLNQHQGQHSDQPHTHPQGLHHYLRISRLTGLRIIHRLGRLLILPINPLLGLQNDLQGPRFHSQPESQHQIRLQIQLQCPLFILRPNRQDIRRWSLRQRQVSDRLQSQRPFLPRDRLGARHLYLPYVQQRILRVTNHLSFLRKPQSRLKFLQKPKSHLKILPPSQVPTNLPDVLMVYEQFIKLCVPK